MPVFFFLLSTDLTITALSHPNVEAPATEDSVPDHEALYIDFTQVA